MSSWNGSWGDSWGDSWGPLGASNTLRGTAAGSSSASAALTGVQVAQVIQGAPWWEVEKAKKKKELEDVLKNKVEEWDDETIALLLLKAA